MAIPRPEKPPPTIATSTRRGSLPSGPFVCGEERCSTTVLMASFLCPDLNLQYCNLHHCNLSLQPDGHDVDHTNPTELRAAARAAARRDEGAGRRTRVSRSQRRRRRAP